jgi:DEAD/DEAH box helicase domain-containing protein
VVRARRADRGRAVPPEHLLGALHALEHAQIAVLPLIAMCDRWDIGGLSTNAHPQTGGPTIFIYDGHPGGIGITRAASTSSSGWSTTRGG